MSNFFSLTFLGTAIMLIILSLSACIKSTDTRGYTFDQEALDKVRSGISTTNDVRTILGSPSSTSNFGDETWYYISNKAEYVAFFTPEVKDQKVVAITFGDNYLVKNIKTYDESNMQDIDFASGKTPTAGNEIGVTEQLLGNIGRFNPGQSGNSGPRHVPY